jgi:hypothetical protein
MSTPKYSFDQVRRAAERVVAQRPDYVYPRRDGDGGSPCMYVHVEGGKDVPGCIVGHIVHELGTEIWETIKRAEEAEYPGSFGIFEAEDYMPGYFDRRTTNFLADMQSRQDGNANAPGEPWGECLKQAEKMDRENVYHQAYGDLQN